MKTLITVLALMASTSSFAGAIKAKCLIETGASGYGKLLSATLDGQNIELTGRTGNQIEIVELGKEVRFQYEVAEIVFTPNIMQLGKSGYLELSAEVIHFGTGLIPELDKDKFLGQSEFRTELRESSFNAGEPLNVYSAASIGIGYDELRSGRVEMTCTTASN